MKDLELIGAAEAGKYHGVPARRILAWGQLGYLTRHKFPVCPLCGESRVGIAFDKAEVLEFRGPVRGPHAKRRTQAAAAARAAEAEGTERPRRKLARKTKTEPNKATKPRPPKKRAAKAPSPKTGTRPARPRRSKAPVKQPDSVKPLTTDPLADMLASPAE